VQPQDNNCRFHFHPESQNSSTARIHAALQANQVRLQSTNHL
jgi:hypothetical protein